MRQPDALSENYGHRSRSVSRKTGLTPSSEVAFRSLAMPNQRKCTQMVPDPHITLPEFSESAFPSVSAACVRSSRNGKADVSLLVSHPRHVFGPVSAYLRSRLGKSWTTVLAELHSRLANEHQFRCVVSQLADHVDFHVENSNGTLRHGTGLLRGQPLLAGWRRRYYVCPDTGKLRKIRG